MIYKCHTLPAGEFITIATKDRVKEKQQQCFFWPSVIPSGEEEEEGESGGAAEHDVAHHVEQAEAHHGGRNEGREPAVAGRLAHVPGTQLLETWDCQSVMCVLF